MAEINNEIGLTQILGGAHSGHGSGSDLGDRDEKRDLATETTAPAEHHDTTTAPAATTTEKATV
jgi:hypothetical protein